MLAEVHVVHPKTTNVIAVNVLFFGQTFQNGGVGETCKSSVNEISILFSACLDHNVLNNITVICVYIYIYIYM